MKRTTALTTEEVYFLVRVGSWSQQELEQWVQARIEEVCCEDDRDWSEDDFSKDWENWDNE